MASKVTIPPSQLLYCILYINSTESHSTNWSELAKNKGFVLLINSFANKAVQAAPCVNPST